MAKHVSNSSSSSTTFGWRLVRLPSGPAPAGDSRRTPSAQPVSRRRDRYQPIELRIRYRGGPESSWLVTARGTTWRFPGWMCIEDIMAKVNDPQGYQRPYSTEL